MFRPADQIPGAQLLTATTFADERGFLLEAWVESKFRARGIEERFRQAVQTRSRRGVVRGMHFQWDPPLGKLVRCAHGAVYDVILDIRIGSPTFGDHFGVELTGENHRILWVPVGLAHGFMALKDDTIVFYQFTNEWSPGGEGAIRWDDPALGIDWPKIPPIVSTKDREARTLAEWAADPRARNFTFQEENAKTPSR